MIEFGKTLRQAREAKGYSTTQLAELTRMSPATIAELENEDFRRIAAPIYGRGFVKLYCEAVGLESKPMVEEFMEIYSGNRDTGIRERPVAEPLPEPEPPVPEPIAREPQPIEQNLFDAPVAPAPVPPSPEPKAMTAPQEFAEPEAPLPTSTVTEPTAEHPVSRYATPFSAVRERTLSLPPTVWRMTLLGTAALLLLLGIVFGLKALHGSVAPTPTEIADDSEAFTSSPTAPASAAGAPRQPQAIPPLYID